MHYSAVDLLLLAATVIGTAIFAWFLVRSGAYRRWPFLLSITVLDGTAGIILYSIAGNYKHYWRAYWCFSIVRSLLSFGLIRDVATSVPNIRMIPRTIGIFSACVCAVCAIGAFAVSLDPSIPRLIHRTALLLQSCVETAWLTFAIAMLALISFKGFAWTREGLTVTGGLLASATTNVVGGQIVSSQYELHRLTDAASTTVYLVVLSSWVNYFSTRKDEALVMATSLSEESRAS